MQLGDQILGTWRLHNEILLLLLDAVPDEGLAAKPSGSRGRDVARVFTHLYRVRVGWLHHHETGKRPKVRRFDKGPAPERSELRGLLETSGAEVEAWLERALRSETAPRHFGRQPVRWLGYLIAHESHHRGQIALALKQSGMPMPEKVAVKGLWGRWIFGR